MGQEAGLLQSADSGEAARLHTLGRRACATGEHLPPPMPAEELQAESGTLCSTREGRLVQHPGGQNVSVLMVFIREGS